MCCAAHHQQAQNTVSLKCVWQTSTPYEARLSLRFLIYAWVCFSVCSSRLALCASMQFSVSQQNRELSSHLRGVILQHCYVV